MALLCAFVIILVSSTYIKYFAPTGQVKNLTVNEAYNTLEAARHM